MDQAGGALGHPVLAGARAADDALRCAATGPVWQCGDDEIEAGLQLVDRMEARLGALRAALLREAEDRSLQDRTRAPSTQRWLTDRFRLSRPQATGRLRQAEQLARHPIVRAALAEAEVTLEQADVAAEALDRIAALPGLTADDRDTAARFLLAQAAALPPRELARAGQALIEALTRTPSRDDPADEQALRREQERAEAEAQAGERNQLTVTRRPGGRVRGRFDLGPLGGATLAAWLRRADQPVPGEDGFEDDRPLAERRGDALVETLAAACCPSSPAEIADADPAEIAEPTDRIMAVQRRGAAGPVSPIALLTVTVTLAELRAGLAGSGQLDTGASVSAATLRQLACDALVVPAVMGGPSQVLDLGRATRSWTLAQRRAIALRDRCCAAPGCDRPPQACQVHHEREWERGGPTDLDNGALLCEFHHRMVHRQGWTVRLAANGFPEFIPPPSIDPQQRPRQHHRYRLQLINTRART
jgi:hypothetical protein